MSDTDTEVVAHLIDYYYKGNPLEAITKVLHRVEGSYALGVIFSEHPDQLFAARKDSPLIVGQNEEGCFIASDVPAILKYGTQTPDPPLRKSAPGFPAHIFP